MEGGKQEKNASSQVESFITSRQKGSLGEWEYMVSFLQRLCKGQLEQKKEDCFQSCCCILSCCSQVEGRDFRRDKFNRSVFCFQNGGGLDERSFVKAMEERMKVQVCALQCVQWLIHIWNGREIRPETRQRAIRLREPHQNMI